MTEQKSKELTITQIKKGAKEVYKKEHYSLNDSTHITYYKIFPTTMLKEMFKDISMVLPKESEVQLTNEDFEKIFMFHLIKKFTGIGKSFKAITLSGQLEELKWLVDNETYGKSLFEIIWNDILPQEEIYKAQEMVFDLLANTQVSKKLIEQSLIQLSELDIENKEILQNFNNMVN